MSLESYQKSGRIEVIDVLRGFTLFGIVLIHMVEQYYAGQMPEQYAEAAIQHAGDMVVAGFLGIFVLGKFYMIFSFLFGLSFYIQLSKSDGKLSFFPRFAWRLFILFIIGMLHHIHYRGDILTIYAMLGFGLLLFYRLPDRILVISALFLILNIPSLIIRVANLIWPFTDSNFFPNQDQETLLHYYTTFTSGPYVELLKENFFDFKDKMAFQLGSGRIYITFGLFLLGLYTGKKKFFEKIPDSLPWIKKMIRLCLWSILGVIVFVVLFFVGSGMVGVTHSQDVQFLAGGFLFDIFNTALSFCYVGWIIQLFQKEKWCNRLMVFNEPGRMGLTTYVMQSAFGLFVFSCIGLSLLNDLGNTLSFAVAIPFFAFQVVFSKWWFSRFEYGPFEWVWRSLTNFRTAKLIKSRKESFG